MAPKQFKLNVGGTKYEVSDTLLDGFPESMLRKITSDTWNQKSNDDDGDDGNNTKEIFIERNGGRFQYVLDFMRDGTVTLPPSIPRQQLIKDMEYYGIDFDDTKIILSVTDESDLFTHFSEYYKEWSRFQGIFESKQKEIDDRYKRLDDQNREIGAECLANKIALKFFELHFSDKVRSGMFKARTISLLLDIANKKEGYNYSIDELQPHLDQYGLKSCDLIFIGRSHNQRGDYEAATKWYGTSGGIDLQLTIDIPH